MPTTRRFRALGALIVLLPLHAASWALGLGNAPSSVVLGRPLDIAVPVRLEAGEELTAECVQAEFWHGEQRLPSDAVRVRVTPGNAGVMVLRLRSEAVIDEPVVTLQLNVGCSTRVQRRYVMLADPGPAAPPAAALPEAPRGATAPAGTTAPNMAAVAPPAPPAPTRATPDTVARTSPAPRRAAAQPAVDRPPRRAAAAERPPRSERPRRQAVAAPATDSGPRLRLDPAEATTAVTPTAAASAIQDALDAVALATNAARQAAEAASAASARALAAEATIERLRAEQRASQAEFERLRLQAVRPTLSSAWTWPLLALVIAVSLLALWLAWRMRGLRQAQELAWARASTLAATSAAGAASAPAATETVLRSTSPLPLITSEMTQPATLNRVPPMPPQRSTAPRSPVAAPEPVDNAMARTQVLPPTLRADDGAPRDVSIEELIDVDQQAEFFIALGQDAAAVDLLVSHLRQTGGGSPLPYLKLLEIHARLGDQQAYERTRMRFNQRFNAYAPEWGQDLAQGRSLEDYPAVLPRLQAAWPRPLDAMAELEALLFRKSRGELFDLPAYRDVLFLYALAREFQEQGTPAEPVDLLLPLDASTERALRVGDARAASDVPLDDRPTAPLDLDLTPQAPAPSIFGDPLVPSSLRGGPNRR